MEDWIKSNWWVDLYTTKIKGHMVYCQGITSPSKKAVLGRILTLGKKETHRKVFYEGYRYQSWNKSKHQVQEWAEAILK